MGLYDDDNEEEPTNLGEDSANNDEIGRSIVNATKKKSSKSISMPEFSVPPIVNKILMYLLIAIVVALLGYALFFFIKPNAISYDISPNPVYMSEQVTSTLRVEIKNINDFTMQNVMVSVKPTDQLFVAIIPSDKREIKILGPDEKRVFEYTISLIGSAPEGDYTININANSGSANYSKQVVWSVKKAK